MHKDLSYLEGGINEVVIFAESVNHHQKKFPYSLTSVVAQES